MDRVDCTDNVLPVHLHHALDPNVLVLLFAKVLMYLPVTQMFWVSSITLYLKYLIGRR